MLRWLAVVAATAALMACGGGDGGGGVDSATQARVVQQAGGGEAAIALGMLIPLIGAGYMVSRHQPPNTWVVQRYGPDGRPAGAETTITAAMGPDASGAGIAPLAGGGYAAIWMQLVEFQRLGGSVYQLMTQSFTAAGAPIGSPRAIAPTTPALYWFPRPVAMPQVAPLTGGGYVVAWAQNNGAGGLAVHTQRFNADGAPAGAPQQAAPLGTGYLGVVGLTSGGYLVIWGTFGTPDGAARAYRPDGAPLAPAQAAGPSWTDFPVDGGQPAVLAPLAGGGAVIAWRRDVFPYVRMVVLAPDAAPLGPARVVDDSTTAAGSSGHSDPAAGSLADGGFVVAWVESGEIHARRFAANGAPAGAETRINLESTDVATPRVVALAGGGFVISWSGVGTDGVRRNYAREFPASGLLAGP